MLPEVNFSAILISLKIAWESLKITAWNKWNFFNTISNAQMISASVTASSTIKLSRQDWELFGLSKSFKLWFVVTWSVVSLAFLFIMQLDSRSTVILLVLSVKTVCLSRGTLFLCFCPLACPSKSFYFSSRSLNLYS